jgi:excisionase family DNA binding protein
MPDRVLVVLPDGRALALDPEVYQTALAEGVKLGSAPGASPAATNNEPLVNADQLAAALGVPATWIETAARQGRIPSYDFGRWRRFRRSEVEAAVRATSGKAARPTNL